MLEAVGHQLRDQQLSILQHEHGNDAGIHCLIAARPARGASALDVLGRKVHAFAGAVDPATGVVFENFVFESEDGNRADSVAR